MYASDRPCSRRGSAVFHLVASLFGMLVAFRNDTPLDQIRLLREEGYSLAEIAIQTGTTVAVVRRLCGTLDPEEQRRHRLRQEDIAQRIDVEPLPWSEKVARWTVETGQSEGTLWRVLQRIRRSR